MALTKIDSTVANIADISKSLVLETVQNGIRDYVDDKLILKSDTTHNHDLTYLKLGGGTLTGPLTLPSYNPSNNYHAAHKKYVDDSITSVTSTLLTLATADGRYLKLSGGQTMTGNFLLKGDPIQNRHPATKSYVDQNFVHKDDFTSLTKPLNISFLSRSIGVFSILADKRMYIMHTGIADSGPASLDFPYSGTILAADSTYKNGYPDVTLNELLFSYTINVKQCATSEKLGFVLSTTGNLYVWGENKYGELGLGHTNDVYAPTLTLSNVEEVFFDNYDEGHYDYYKRMKLVVKKDDGYLYVTGYNGWGNLGLGDTTNRNTWVKLTAAGTNPLFVKNIAHGLGGLIIQKSDKTIWVTGWNGFGQLGTGNTTNVTTLTNVSSAWKGTNTNLLIKDVVGGFGYGDDTRTAIAMLLDDGTRTHVRTCGYNAWGQIGNGTTTNTSTPFLVFNTTSTSRIKQIMAVGNGAGGFAALDEGGQLFVWGWNGSGAFGLGNTTSQYTPVLSKTGVSELMLNIPTLTSGHTAFFVKDTADKLWVSGNNLLAQTGLLISTNATVSSWTQVKLGNINIMKMGYLLFHNVSNYVYNSSGITVFAVTDSNSIYTWGRDSMLPKLADYKLVR